MSNFYGQYIGFGAGVAVAAGFPYMGGRGVFNGRHPGNTSVIDYVTIATLGDAADFGDMSVNRVGGTGMVSNKTRGLTGGGGRPAANVIDYITISTIGNATDFGDLVGARGSLAPANNGTRGVFAAGYVGGAVDTIEYVTVATIGNASDFGDCTITSYVRAGVSGNGSSRGVFGTGLSGASNVVEMDYITIATTGDALDFGDLGVPLGRGAAGASNDVRGLWSGGYSDSPAGLINVITYITIATLGDTTDFGDLTQSCNNIAACGDGTKYLRGGGDAGGAQNVIDYVTIATTGNASDFGDLTETGYEHGACSGE